MALNTRHNMNMNMAQRLEMVMTPQMIQSMEMLQLPLMELEQRLQQELLENPALELAEMKSQEDDYADDPVADPDAADPEEPDSFPDDEASADFRNEDAIDCDWDAYYDERPPQRIHDDDEDRFDPIANAPSRGMSLHEHLERQVGLLTISPRLHDILLRLIGALEPSGYLLGDPMRILRGEREAFLAPRHADPDADVDVDVDADPADGDLLTGDVDDDPVGTPSPDDPSGVRPDADLWDGAGGEGKPGMDPPVTAAELKEAFSILHSLSPAGVGARTPQECLLLQLRDREEPLVPLARTLVEEHLEDIAANRLPQIARAQRVTVEQVKDAVQLIRTLAPHPGYEFGEEAVMAVRPDILVDLVELEPGELSAMERGIELLREELATVEMEAETEADEYRVRAVRGRLADAGTDLQLVQDRTHKWDVRLPSGLQPDISDLFLALFDTTSRGQTLRRMYERDPNRRAEFEEMEALVRDAEKGKMLREKYHAARWILIAVAQRERTLYRVTRRIVAVQKEYLSGRVDAPQPLMMQDVADAIEIDISTVSRAVRDKYMDTPLGLKPLRMFFTRAITTEAQEGGGGGVSNVQVMSRIREMIESEDRARPLKDDQIQRRLSQEGIEIKRRTVAKYRNNLGFPSHSHRREY